MFVFVLCLVCLMLLMSLYWLFLISPSVFSSVNLGYQVISVFPIFRHICVVCSSIYGFWLPLWYLQTLLWLSLLYNLLHILLEWLNFLCTSTDYSKSQIGHTIADSIKGEGAPLINDKESAADRLIDKSMSILYTLYIIAICIFLMSLLVAFAVVNLSPDSMSI